MRITKKTILAIGLIASSLTLNSCDYNDNNEVLRRPTALVTVYPSAPDGFFVSIPCRPYCIKQISQSLDRLTLAYLFSS